MTSRRKLWLGLTLLAALHLAALSAKFVGPYDPDLQSRALPFAPPTHLHVVDTQGRLHLRPFVYRWVSRPSNFGIYDEDQTQTFPVKFFVRATTHESTVRGPESGAKESSSGAEFTERRFGRSDSGLRTPDSRTRLFGVDEPARIFLLGSDGYGRDQLSRLLHGAQVSLLAGLLAAGLSLGLGLMLGTVAGFYGSWFDQGIMRFSELFLALPWLYLLFAARAFLPLHLSSAQSFLLLVVVIGLTGWARPARLIRGVVLSAKERDYVTASRGFGASDFYLLRRHVLPQAVGVVVTQAGLLIPQYILAEVALSYLGLGVGEPTPSLGNLLAELQQYNIMASYWWMFLPGVSLIPVFAGYFGLASALHERAGLAQV